MYTDRSAEYRRLCRVRNKQEIRMGSGIGDRSIADMVISAVSEVVCTYKLEKN